MPLMLSEGVNKRGLSLNHFVKICSERPAQVWQVWPRKGSLQVGADGDLTVIDLDREWTVDETKQHSKNNVTPWNGWTGKGKPVMTIVRGQVVLDEGELVAEKPGGQMVPPLKKGWQRPSSWPPAPGDPRGLPLAHRHDRTVL